MILQDGALLCHKIQLPCKMPTDFRRRTFLFTEVVTIARLVKSIYEGGLLKLIYGGGRLKNPPFSEPVVLRRPPP